MTVSAETFETNSFGKNRKKPVWVVKTADEILREEMKQFKSVPGYVNALAANFDSNPNYMGNLAQLQRMSRFINCTEGSERSQEYLEGFYWGEILGLAVGDRLMGKGWAFTSHEIINKTFLSNYLIVANEFMAPQLTLDEQPRVREESKHIVYTANVLLAMLEAEERELPTAYQVLIDEWAPLLSKDIVIQDSIKSGFGFLFNVASAQYEHSKKQLEERKILETALSGIRINNLRKNDRNPDGQRPGNT